MPYRTIVREFGCGLCWSELIMARGLVERHGKTLELMPSRSEDHPIVIQLGGGEPEIFADAAEIAQSYGADAIDINCGCPVPKMVKRGYGVALMKTPERIRDIVTAVKKRVNVPVFVKIRAGYTPQSPDAVEIARLAESAGANAITVHGRYRDDFFRGVSDWGVIAKVKEAVTIPVIGNGDIKSYADAQRMIAQTGCDAVMAGRATLGRPWLFSELINQTAFTNDYALWIRTVDRHAALIMDQYGEKRGCTKLRTVLCYYTRGISHIRSLRPEIIRISSLDDFHHIRAAIISLMKMHYPNSLDA